MRLAWAVPLLCALPAAAAPEKPPPVFGTGISIVSVPVFVTDDQGRATPGLRAEDFELIDDGRAVPIVSFQYVDTTAEDAQDEIRSVPALRRRFLLLFDLSFTDVAGVHRARRAGKEFVRRQLADADLAAVASFDVNHGLRLVANFTEDRALLAHAVDTLGIPQIARINDPLGLAATVAVADIDIGARNRTGDPTAAVVESVVAPIVRRARVLDEQLYRAQVLNLAESMKELATALRGVEGRKQIVYLSAGFDSQTLVGLSGADLREDAEAVVQGRIYDQNPERYGDTGVRRVLSVMARSLQSADCVIHSVDVTGMGRDDSLGQTTVARDLSRNVAGRESLHLLAADTGGRFYKDANDLGDALGEMLDLTSRYYVLGYQPEDLKGPGAYHKLKVKVRRKGSRASHRAGFFERQPRAAQSPLQRKFEAAQLVMTGAGPNALKFSALALPFPSDGQLQRLGLVMQVPRDQLHWNGSGSLALEVYGYAVGPDGSVADHLAQMARLEPHASASAPSGFSFYGSLDVPPGQYTLKLMVQEPASGASGAQFIDVTVPPRDPSAGFLLPPLVMDDADAWVTVAATGASAPPFSVAGRPFLPRTTFRVTRGSPEKVVLIAYEPELRGDPAAGIEITSSVKDAAGSAVDAGRFRLEKVYREDGGRRTYVLNYTPEGLPPGDYTLRMGVGESGARLESYSLLRVAQ